MPYIITRGDHKPGSLWQLYHEVHQGPLDPPNRALLGSFNPRTPDDLLAIARERELPLADTILVLWTVRTGQERCSTSTEISAQAAMTAFILASVPFAFMLVVSQLVRQRR